MFWSISPYKHLIFPLRKIDKSSKTDFSKNHQVAIGVVNA